MAKREAGNARRRRRLPAGRVIEQHAPDRRGERRFGAHGVRAAMAGEIAKDRYRCDERRDDQRNRAVEVQHRLSPSFRRSRRRRIVWGCRRTTRWWAARIRRRPKTMARVARAPAPAPGPGPGGIPLEARESFRRVAGWGPPA